MWRNYFIIAYRHLFKNKVFSIINFTGLTIGMTACLLIMYFVSFELSYDKFHKNSENIYRVSMKSYKNNELFNDMAVSSSSTGECLKKDFPEVIDYVRFMPNREGAVITATTGAKPSEELIEFKLKGFENAKKVSLAGSFNGWSRDTNLMEWKDSIWYTKLNLYADSYYYKFVVEDTLWITDPENEIKEIDANGNLNSYFEIKNKSIKAQKEISFRETNFFYVDSNVFDIFDFKLIKGDAKSALSKANNVVITESAAKKYFGEENPIGKFIKIDGKDNFQITGILQDIPLNSHIQFNFLFANHSILQGITVDAQKWGWHNFYTYILLKPNSKDIINDKLPSFIHKYAGKLFDELNYKPVPYLTPIKEIHLYSNKLGELSGGGDYKVVLFLSIIAFFILFIAWGNYINLSTARSIDRAKEVGIRKVVGAVRSQITVQFLMEALLINFLSLLFAFIFSQLLLPLFVFFTEIKLENIFFCEYVYFIIFIIVFLIGSVLSGLYPAFLLSSYLPIEVLKGKLKSNKKGLVIRKGLVVFQFSISFLLIASTIVVFFQLEYLKNRDLGFNQEQILVVRSPYVIKQRSKFPEKMLSFKSGLSHNSNIKDISVSASIPGFWYNWSTSSATREGSKSGTNSMTYAIGVSESYIPFYKLKLIEGTNFLEKHESFEVCILSETALKSFGFENAKAALGKKIIDIDVSNGIEIVGVIKDYYHFSAKESPQALILIYDKSPWGYISFKVNVNNLESVIADIKKQFEIVFPNNPFEYFFLDDNFNRQYQNEKQFGKIFSLFSMFALFVALLGQFGLVSFNVVQRAKEIGVRKIMGATPLQIVVLLSKDFGKLLLVAFIISIPVSYFSIQVWLYSFTYRISPSPIIFLFTAILISLVAFLTSAIESYKTAITNPVKSLKSE